MRAGGQASPGSAPGPPEPGGFADFGDPGHPAGAGPAIPTWLAGSWGERRPGTLFRALLAASRAVPQQPVVKQLAFALRRMARAAAEDPVDVEHWGHRLRLLTRGNISESTFLFMPRRWDVPERRLLAREVGPGAVFVDVGANAGGYVWWVLHVLGRACTVLAVEPDPSLVARLRFNLAANGSDNVRVEHAAVGLEPGMAWLSLDPRNRGQNALAAEVGPGRVRVPVRRLHEIVESAGVGRIDALKIDVEGLDAAVLGDFFDRAPAPLRPRLLLFERSRGETHRDLVTRLERIGYREALSTRMNVALRRDAE